MALSVSEFKTLHQEFGNTPDAVVQVCLDEAYRRTPEKVWGTLQDDGARYLAAHLITIRPQAKEMRIGMGGQDKIGNLYDRERQRLIKIVASGFRVVGSD